jgi:hypothetical protein
MLPSGFGKYTVHENSFRRDILPRQTESPIIRAMCQMSLSAKDIGEMTHVERDIAEGIERSRNLAASLKNDMEKKIVSPGRPAADPEEDHVENVLA